MERLKLKAAREAKGHALGRHFSQQDVATTIGCTREAYSLWERGIVDPQGYWVGKLCTFFGVEDPKTLDLVPTAHILTVEDIQKMLERYDRRELIAIFQSLSAFAGV